jgi:hypothetical protein
MDLFPRTIICFPSLQDEIARSQQMSANLVEKVFNRCNPENVRCPEWRKKSNCGGGKNQRQSPWHAKCNMK